MDKSQVNAVLFIVGEPLKKGDAQCGWDTSVLQQHGRHGPGLRTCGVNFDAKVRRQFIMGSGRDERQARAGCTGRPRAGKEHRHPPGLGAAGAGGEFAQ